MKRLLAAAGAALLGALMLVQLAPGTSRDVSSHITARDARLTAEAHAAFIKDMSAHAPEVRTGKWASPGPLHTPGTKVGHGTLTSLPSVNWSGFADASATAGTFTRVSGNWILPAVTCLPAPYQNQDAFIANWVGIDGATDQTVEQLGTGAQCFEGVLYYYVWYEMYPSATVQEGTLACIEDNVDCPQPGDRISASVTVKPGGNYTLSLTDYTTPGNNFTVSQSCAPSICLDESAEWVIERPATFIADGTLPQILPLVDFNRTGFFNGRLVANGRPSSILGYHGTVYNIDMSDDFGAYYLDCVGQFEPPGTILSVEPNQCPVVPPFFHGSTFFATWDSSF
ncbi:MAG TPA: G1 family glutamic endopeptidase [Streptosporangiaceae bacterium]|nr:G1 family glutamic endopeptidase [Streptosporangiaceae bacterium]